METACSHRVLPLAPAPREPGPWAELGISRPASASSRRGPWPLGGRLMSCGWPARSCRLRATRARLSDVSGLSNRFSWRKTLTKPSRDFLVCAVGPQLPRIQARFLDSPKTWERQYHCAHAKCNSIHWLRGLQSRAIGFGYIFLSAAVGRYIDSWTCSCMACCMLTVTSK